jgi:O-antigen ligase
MVFNDKTVSWVSSRGNVLLLLFFFFILLSSLFAFKPSVSWDKIDIIINWVILYFLIINILNTERRFIIFILLFFLVNFKMSQFGFRTFVTYGYSSWGVSGSPGWFKNAGDLGIQMCIFFPLSAAYVLALKNHWGKLKKFFFYLMPITAVITVIATASRGAQLGVVAIGVWFLLKSRGGIKAIVGILIFGWVLYSILPDKMLQEFENAGSDYTSRSRLVHWEFGKQVAREHPVFGVGYENWLSYCWYKNPEGFFGGTRWCLAAHNTYITGIAELGYPAMALYIFIALYMFILNARTRANAKLSGNRFFHYLAHGLDGGMVGYLVATVFFTVLYYPLIYVQLGMTVALYQLSKIELAKNKIAMVPLNK